MSLNNNNNNNKNTKHNSFISNNTITLLAITAAITLLNLIVTSSQQPADSTGTKYHYNLCEYQYPYLSLYHNFTQGDTFYFNLDDNNSTFIALNIYCNSKLYFKLSLYTNDSTLVSLINEEKLFMGIDFNTTGMVDVLKYFSNNTIFYDPYKNYYFNVTEVNSLDDIYTLGLSQDDIAFTEYKDTITNTTYVYRSRYDYTALKNRGYDSDIIVCWLSPGTSGYDNEIINSQRDETCFDYYKTKTNGVHNYYSLRYSIVDGVKVEDNNKNILLPYGFNKNLTKTDFIPENVKHYDDYYSFSSVKEFDSTTNVQALAQFMNKYQENKTITFFIGSNIDVNGEFTDSDLIKSFNTKYIDGSGYDYFISNFTNSSLHMLMRSSVLLFTTILFIY